LSLDRLGVPAEVQVWRAASQLWCAGVEVDFDALGEQFRPTPSPSAAEPPRMTFRLRREGGDLPLLPPLPRSAVERRDPGTEERRLPRAPRLASRATRQAAPPACTPIPAPTGNVVATSPPPVRWGLPAAEMIAAQVRITEAHTQYLRAQAQALQAYGETAARVYATWIARARFGASQAVPRSLVLAPPAAAKPSPAPANLPGPKFDRAQLEVLASGRISIVFGPSFAGQDEYALQVRMPAPPLLLCDRVLGIEGEPHSMGRGVIWTATDVGEDSWYLDRGRMPPGVFIECGQADLLLISWLGVDALNKGERAYRLLGCELVFNGELPQPGDTLEYEIRIDGHSRQGDVRLFFFNYECRIGGAVRISVRNGQAGFFTVKELENSSGVIWSPQTAAYNPDGRIDPAPQPTAKRRFSHEEVQAYLAGDLVTCFGPQFLWADAHTRTPGTPRDHRNFLGEVTELDLAGGPAGRGYLRVETEVRGDEWFFEGHFKNDPCMPGTLMADACLQAMAFYLAATGRTLHRDGWRFQPVRGEPYTFLCRGQVTPHSRQIVYELFVDEIVDDDMPILRAHALCTVDGRKAFLCERLALQLVPDWPLSSMRQVIDEAVRSDPRPVARIGNFPVDYLSLIHCAWGRPSQAFGPGFAHYDGPSRAPRLPGPPYHFMTRVTALHGEMGQMKAGGRMTALYDIPADAWYFAESDAAIMPNCVLMEVALQPCGWLASFTVKGEAGGPELLFRNLDGDSIQYREVRPGDRTITTEVEMLSLDRVGDLIIMKFDVRCIVDGESLLQVQTAFGFFPPLAMADQKGFRTEAADLARIHQESDFRLDLTDRPARLFRGPARLPDSKLLMIDRITGYWPDGGNKGLGLIRAEKSLASKDWFFKAHFYQDPVQPGSLGVEAMLQAAQALMLLEGMDTGLSVPRFEPVAIGKRTLWHYRGQVTPDRKVVIVDFEVEARGCDARGPFVIGRSTLWVDELQIYQAPLLGMRLVNKEPGDQHRKSTMDGSLNVDTDVTFFCERSAGPGPNKARAAARNHASCVLGVRPSDIRISEDGACRNLPLNRWRLAVSEPADEVAVRSGAPEVLDWPTLQMDWQNRMKGCQTFVQDLGISLIQRYVRRVTLADPDGFARLKGRPVLYLGNHQTGVESFLFLSIITSLTGLPAGAIAKREHRDSWVGLVHQLADADIGEDNPMKLWLFDRSRPGDLLRLLREYGVAKANRPASLLVHTDGTRAKVAGAPVSVVSSVLTDLAVEEGLDIVPVRFAGGLPTDVSEGRLEFPVQAGQQDYFIGTAIEPQVLAKMPFAERSAFVRNQLNMLGPLGAADVPLLGDANFRAAVIAARAAGLSEVQAHLRPALEAFPGLGPQSRRLLSNPAEEPDEGVRRITEVLIGCSLDVQP
jgi:3-hydroxymyristoyl/3-hydroxydecanoyl-(acyl carrier protein) dehydratase